MTLSDSPSPNKPETVRTIADMRARVAAWRAAGETVGLVPTMGALHEGHLSLMRQAREACDRVIVSIFVNPKQFSPSEDLDSYPRTEDSDRQKLSAEGVDLLFAPKVAEVYPDGFSTTVSVAGITDCLCGASRPNYFSGMATVVTKLLLQSLPDVAIFGEKDYQQLLVIKRLARDLDIPVRIDAGPTVREADGLALSSRNAYLTAAERAIAPVLNRTMRELAENLARPGGDVTALIEDAKARLREAGFGEIDYLEFCDAETLSPIEETGSAGRLFAAAWLGSARLIDNIPVGR